jgi:PKD repeat protein
MDLLLSYHPTLLGPAFGTLHIVPSVGLERTVNLNGTGYTPVTIPMLQLLDTYDFGDVFVGSTQTTQLKVSLTADWAATTGPGTIDSYNMVGEEDFPVLSVTNSTATAVISFPKTLAPGDTIIFNVAFHPASEGASVGILQLSGSDGQIYETTMTGSGITPDPEIDVNPNSVIVNGSVGTPTSTTFQISNIGGGELVYNIDTLALPGWITVNPTSGAILAGSSETINLDIDLTSIAAGNYSYLMSINSNDPLHTHTSLMVTVVVEDVDLLADFYADTLTGHPPLGVQFHDSSISNATTTWAVINTWKWDFNNDGTFDSFEQNPRYVYSTPGLYSVRLVVGTNTGLTSTKLRTDYINVTNSAPVIAVPLTTISMQEDTPWGPTSVDYVFSDPNGDPLTITAKGSLHLNASIYPDGLYIVPAADWYGVENITITALDPYGLGVAQAITVTVASVNDPPAVSIPTDLYFIRNSTFRVDFAQYIEDPDNPDSELALQIVPMSVPPTIDLHYYPIDAPNTVGQLTVDFSSTSQTEVLQNFQIQVNDETGRLITFASFNMHVLEHFNPQITLDDTYHFAGQSVGFNDATLGNPDHWLWEFGDGETSTQKNPVHQYLISGLYDVRLTLGNSQVPAEDRMVFMPGLINLEGTAVTVDFVPDTWTVLGSPYNLFGEVVIDSTTAVVIDPNVIVNCFGETPVQIQGSLQASGATFRPQTGSGFWGGLKFTGAGLREPSQLSNCQLIDAFSPIIVEGASPVISAITITLSDTTQICEGTGITLRGESGCQITDAELVNYRNGLLIETVAGNRDTPSLTNVRIRNSSSVVRTNEQPSVAATITGTATLSDVEINEYDTGLQISTTEATSTSSPSLTNVRIRNTSSTIRSVSTGMQISGNTIPHLNSILIENVTNGIILENITASLRDTPTLTNVRIRNTSSVVRNLATAMQISDVPKVTVENVELDSFPIGIKIGTTHRTDSNPTLTNVRIRNTTSTVRNSGHGLVISGAVSAIINDLQIDDYAYGLSYDKSVYGRTDTPTSLTNVRIRNTSSASRQQNAGAYFKGLGKFSLNDVEINDYSEGMRIEKADTRTDTNPTLTNVRIRNTTSTVRTDNIGLYLGQGVTGSLRNSLISNAAIGIFVADGNSTIMENNHIENCYTGLKAAGTNPLPLRKFLFTLEEDFFWEHLNQLVAAFDLYGAGPWNIYQNTLFNYPRGVWAHFATVNFHSNIVWEENLFLEPFINEGSTIYSDFNDIYYPAGVYPGIGNLNTDPLFNPDFSLQRNSPCIDAGSPSMQDPDGSVADQGAFIYLHKAEANAVPRFVVVGTTVDFLNTSIGHDYPDTQVNWDIGANGSVESHNRNFSYTFNTPGIYDLALTMQSGLLIDSKVYPSLIVVSSQALQSPQNPLIAESAGNIELSWDPVNHTVEGLPIEVQFYLVFKSESPNGFYTFSGLVIAPQTSWTDYAQASINRGFYLILGFAGTREEVLDFIGKNQRIRR